MVGRIRQDAVETPCFLCLLFFLEHRLRFRLCFRGIVRLRRQFQDVGTDDVHPFGEGGAAGVGCSVGCGSLVQFDACDDGVRCALRRHQRHHAASAAHVQNPLRVFHVCPGSEQNGVRSDLHGAVAVVDFKLLKREHGGVCMVESLLACENRFPRPAADCERRDGGRKGGFPRQNYSHSFRFSVFPSRSPFFRHVFCFPFFVNVL